MTLVSISYVYGYLSLKDSFNKYVQSTSYVLATADCWGYSGTYDTRGSFLSDLRSSKERWH